MCDIGHGVGVDLNVWGGGVGGGAHEAADLVHWDGERALAGEDVLDACKELADGVAEAVVERGLGGAEIVVYGEVVLEAFADLGEGLVYGDTVALQQVCGADA